MLILVGLTINVALNGGLFNKAREAAKQEERELIHDQIVSAMKVREGGKLNVKGTYEDAKAILTSQGKTVALVEPTSEAEITDSTTSVIFTVTGKYGTFKYQITDTEIKLIGEVTNGDDNRENDPVDEEGYLTSIEGLGTGVSLVQYENLTATFTISASSSTGEAGGSFAYDSQKMFTIYGGGSYSDTMYQTEFNTMAKGVKKYGGFYVGRYETGGFNESTVVSQPNRGKTSGDINNTTWYKMYAMQKAFGNEIVGSSMIWGCQYDQVMKFVDGKNSFSVTTVVADRHSGSSTTGTGNTPADFVANIYDLEGNMYEWTLEAQNTIYRVIRGGFFHLSYPASYRFASSPDSQLNGRGSRLTLYVQ